MVVDGGDPGYTIRVGSRGHIYIREIFAKMLITTTGSTWFFSRIWACRCKGIGSRSVCKQSHNANYVNVYVYIILRYAIARPTKIMLNL